MDKQSVYVDRLLTDYRAFQARVATAQISPTSMANRAKELLDEVATGKITGEEDIWSGTDLFVNYSTVTATQRKALAAAVDALAEPRSHLAAALTPSAA